MEMLSNGDELLMKDVTIICDGCNKTIERCNSYHVEVYPIPYIRDDTTRIIYTESEPEPEPVQQYCDMCWSEMKDAVKKCNTTDN